MIHYIEGDATKPCIDKGIRVIVHVVNDIGKWGAGFSGALGKAYPASKKHYQSKFKYKRERCELGEVQWVFVKKHLAIVNMVAQHKISRDLLNYRPIRYESLEECLDRVAGGARALESDGGKSALVTLHMPRIGCGLAGGTWDVVGPMVEESLWDRDVYVYDLPDALRP